MFTLEIDLASSSIKAITEGLINYFGFEKNIIPEVIETFSALGYFSMEIAELFENENRNSLVVNALNKLIK